MPLDWNQINEDDSSVSGYESTQDDNDDLPEPQILKMLSEVATPKSLTSRLSTHDVVAENLQKLSLIDSQEVWLFVPKPYKNDTTDYAVNILKSHESIKKVVPNSAGWNVLVTKIQEAKNLIVNSFKKDHITLRFYVSTKNSQGNHKNTSRKGSTEHLEQNLPFDSPVKLRKLHHDDQHIKKKVKYQQKFTEKKLPPRQNSIEKLMKQQLKENPKKSQLENQKNVHKQIQQQKPQETTKTQKIEQKFSEKEPNLVLQKITSDQVQKSQSSQEPEPKTEIEASSPEQDPEEEYDSEQSLERMKKALKRKNKKLNKKKPGSKQTDSVDRNNPFSLLT